KRDERRAEGEAARLQLASERGGLGRKIPVRPQLGGVVARPGDLVQDPPAARVRPVGLVPSPADRRVPNPDQGRKAQAACIAGFTVFGPFESPSTLGSPVMFRPTLLLPWLTVNGRPERAA